MHNLLGDQDTVHLQLSIASTPVEIYAGHGLLSRADTLMPDCRSRRILLISDEHVAPLYATAFLLSLQQKGYDAHLFVISSGEYMKSLDTVSLLYAQCYALEVERNDVVVAIGGGVVSDIAGVVAGTYLRGLEFYQFPTSIIAMASASIGGKVGVNYENRKNLIGLFKQPSFVLADLDTLQTLPTIEQTSGLGELITVGVLGVPNIFQSLEENGVTYLSSLIGMAIVYKSKVVEKDPFDQLNVRNRLNLGHTFGHAIEALSDFRLPHGLAVAIGLNIASQLAVALGLCPQEVAERIRRTLLALNLPVALIGYQPQEVIEAMRGDKKRSSGRLQWVLPVAIGEVILVDERAVPHSLLEDVLRQIVWEGRMSYTGKGGALSR